MWVLYLCIIKLQKQSFVINYYIWFSIICFRSIESFSQVTFLWKITMLFFNCTIKCRNLNKDEDEEFLWVELCVHSAHWTGLVAFAISFTRGWQRGHYLWSLSIFYWLVMKYLKIYADDTAVGLWTPLTLLHMHILFEHTLMWHHIVYISQLISNLKGRVCTIRTFTTRTIGFLILWDCF